MSRIQALFAILERAQDEALRRRDEGRLTIDRIRARLRGCDCARCRSQGALAP